MRNDVQGSWRKVGSARCVHHCITFVVPSVAILGFAVVAGVLRLGSNSFDVQCFVISIYLGLRLTLFLLRALQPFRPQAGTVASQGLELDCSPIGGLRPETPSASWKASCKQFNMLDSQSLPDVPEALDANRPDLQQPESSVGLRKTARPSSLDPSRPALW